MHHSHDSESSYDAARRRKIIGTLKRFGGRQSRAVLAATASPRAKKIALTRDCMEHFFRGASGQALSDGRGTIGGILVYEVPHFRATSAAMSAAMNYQNLASSPMENT